MPSRHCLVPAQDDIHIERVKLDTAAASACLFGSDERRSRTDEWVEDNIAPFGHVEQRIFQHANRLDGGVILKTLSSFGAHTGGIALTSHRGSKPVDPERDVNLHEHPNMYGDKGNVQKRH